MKLLGKRRRSGGKTLRKRARLYGSSSNVRAGAMLSVLRGGIQELKEFQQITDQVAAAGGSVICLNQVAQGTDAVNRIARHVVPNGVDIIYSFIPPGISGGSGQITFGYVALVWDYNPNAALPTYTTVFDTGSTPYAYTAFRNTLQDRERFKILWEQRVSFNGYSTGVPNFTENIYGRHYVSLKGLSCEYKLAATGVPTTGGLYLCFCDSTNTGTSAAPRLIANCKFTFKDS